MGVAPSHPDWRGGGCGGWFAGVPLEGVEPLGVLGALAPVWVPPPIGSQSTRISGGAEEGGLGA